MPAYQTILDAEAAIPCTPATRTLRQDVNEILAAVEDNSVDDATRIHDIELLLAHGHETSRAWFAALGIAP